MYNLGRSPFELVDNACKAIRDVLLIRREMDEECLYLVNKGIHDIEFTKGQCGIVDHKEYVIDKIYSDIWLDLEESAQNEARALENFRQKPFGIRS